jgi:BirA family biotin operon repressor/biotin-[acetyl-CoA-carboxylase] ligase
MCAAAALRRPGPPGTRFVEVVRFTELDSTNRYLLDEARAGAPPGLVAVAGHQSAGRGRLGRRWQAPPDANLLASVLLRPDLEVADRYRCTAVLALAAADACAALSGVGPDLKWPNDLTVGDRKLAGVLAESDGASLVVGIGLNVRWPPPPSGDPDAGGSDAGDPDAAAAGVGESAAAGDDTPGAVAASATSLWREMALRGVSAPPPAPDDLLDPLLLAAEPRLADLSTPDGRRRQAEEYRSRCVTVGTAVRVSLPGGTVIGTALDVTDEGHLAVEVGSGSARTTRTVAAGDVVHLRPGL